jgi:hypothetical protein
MMPWVIQTLNGFFNEIAQEFDPQIQRLYSQELPPFEGKFKFFLVTPVESGFSRTFGFKTQTLNLQICFDSTLRLEACRFSEFLLKRMGYNNHANHANLEILNFDQITPVPTGRFIYFNLTETRLWRSQPTNDFVHLQLLLKLEHDYPIYLE